MREKISALHIFRHENEILYVSPVAKDFQSRTPYDRYSRKYLFQNNFPKYKRRMFRNENFCNQDCVVRSLLASAGKVTCPGVIAVALGMYLSRLYIVCLVLNRRAIHSFRAEKMLFGSIMKMQNFSSCLRFGIYIIIMF